LSGINQQGAYTTGVIVTGTAHIDMNLGFHV
jgi:hypothetical protein